MPFFYKLYTKNNLLKNNQVSLRKNLCVSARHNQFIHNVHNGRNQNTCKKRASFSASNLRASMTVEAAAALFIFIISMAGILSIFQIFYAYACVDDGLRNAARIASAADGSSDTAKALIYPEFYMNTDSKALERYGVSGGTAGVSLIKTKVSEETGDIHVTAFYSIKPPLLVIPGCRLNMHQSVYLKLWNGYHKGTDKASDNQGNKKIYYVTDYESVYHKDRQCTHLKLSISLVDFETAKKMRNAYHSRYTPCERCAAKAVKNGMVYITTDGDKYHTSLNCSGLKRTIHEITDKGTLKPCERCGSG